MWYYVPMHLQVQPQAASEIPLCHHKVISFQNLGKEVLVSKELVTRMSTVDSVLATDREVHCGLSLDGKIACNAACKPIYHDKHSDKAMHGDVLTKTSINQVPNEDTANVISCMCSGPVALVHAFLLLLGMHLTFSRASSTSK